MLAYLVIREGAKWTDVFRLMPGQIVTIGRAPDNHIVMKDDRASRYHAELYQKDGRWVLRDMDSRNGTLVADQPIQGDYALAAGELIRIGSSQMAFVYDLAKAFPDSSAVLDPNALINYGGGATGTMAAGELDQEPTMITHRRVQTKFLEPGDDDGGPPNIGQAAARLCRLAFELAKAPDAVTLANQALEGLFEATRVDAGALLLTQDHHGDEPPSGDALEVIASRSDTDLPYHRVSTFLAETILREGEAVLARNVSGDSTVSTRDSKGEIHATSLMCAPIRRGRQVLGLIHLYSTRPERHPDPDDLEFTLAVADTVAVALQNLKRRQELAESLNRVRDENLELRERLGVQSEIIGRSRAMAQVAQAVARAAPSNATVLIRGESGVGKELVARAVHYSSPRRKAPFICLNCAALSESILESELFGHERGAFTGAHARKLGKFEAAHGGTLMLDEIGEMSPTTQAKFLRVLEGHPFERVGGSEPVQVDVRVIAATNRDLEKDVEEKLFRRDLYFRLRVLEIVVPPLRKRPEDIAELADYFFQKFTAETGRKLRGFTPRAMEQMLRYRWPGNVRELKNVVERAVVLARGEYIDQADLVLSTIPTSNESGEADSSAGLSGIMGTKFHPCSLEEMERRHILAVLKSTGGNKSRAAGILGIERSTLDRKLRRYEAGEKLPEAPGKAS